MRLSKLELLLQTPVRRWTQHDADWLINLVHSTIPYIKHFTKSKDQDLKNACEDWLARLDEEEL